jgi:hypothetical protein
VSVSADVLRCLVDSVWGPPSERRERELEVVRARLAGGESVERLAADYHVEPEAIVAVCQRPPTWR